MVLSNPFSGVFNTQADMGRAAVGVYGDDPFLADGVQGVGEQIEDHLFQVGFVPAHQRQVLFQVFLQDKALVAFDPVLQDFQGVPDKGVHTQGAKGGFPGPTEGQQGSDDFLAPVTFLDYGFGVFLEIISEFCVQAVLYPGQASEQSLGEALDPCQRVVDFMGYTGSEHTDGGHFFSLVKLGLVFLFQGDVAFE